MILAGGLRAGLDELARVMPTDLRTHQDILEYRRVGAARTITARCAAPGESGLPAKVSSRRAEGPRLRGSRGRFRACVPDGSHAP